MPADLRDALHSSLGAAYALERELGRGGIATVYLARDFRQRRPVALKLLHPELAASLGAERFLREIETAANPRRPRRVRHCLLNGLLRGHAARPAC